MAASNRINPLIGKQRYQSTSDRQREKLQAQISTYAIRHQADEELRLQTEALEKLRKLSDCEPQARGLDRVIGGFMEMVDSVMARQS